MSGGAAEPDAAHAHNAARMPGIKRRAPDLGVRLRPARSPELAMAGTTCHGLDRRRSGPRAALLAPH